MRSTCHENVHSLKVAIGAVLHHCSAASREEARNHFCPTGEDSCCKYHANKDNYRPRLGLPIAIREFMKPLFMELSDEKLLAKCLHGKAQNSNESLNGFIQKRYPKDIFVGRKVLELGVASAVISFNDGTKLLIDVLKELKIVLGYFSELFCHNKDVSRVSIIKTKSTQETKIRRKRLRAARKGFSDGNEVQEGLTYGCGKFQLSMKVFLK